MHISEYKRAENRTKNTQTGANARHKAAYCLPEDTARPRMMDAPRQFCRFVDRSVHRPGDVVKYVGHRKTARALQEDAPHRTAYNKRDF